MLCNKTRVVSNKLLWKQNKHEIYLPFQILKKPSCSRSTGDLSFHFEIPNCSLQLKVHIPGDDSDPFIPFKKVKSLQFSMCTLLWTPSQTKPTHSENTENLNSPLPHETALYCYTLQNPSSFCSTHLRRFGGVFPLSDHPRRWSYFIITVINEKLFKSR